jgi:hypothetical protein
MNKIKHLMHLQTVVACSRERLELQKSLSRVLLRRAKREGLPAADCLQSVIRKGYVITFLLTLHPTKGKKQVQVMSVSRLV